MLAKCGDYSIWSDTAVSVVGNTIINILVTDGENSWESMLEESNLPLSRKNQNWAESVPTFLSILRRENVIDYQLQLDIPCSDLELTITENIKGTSLRSLVLKLALPRSENFKKSVNTILSRSSETIIKYRDDVKRVKETESEFINTINVLGHDLNEAVSYKEELQTEMLRAMCILLNSKSSEIRQLRAKLDEIELEKDNGSNALNEEADSEPPVSAVKLSDTRAVPQPKKAKVPAARPSTKSKRIAALIAPICSFESETNLECESVAAVDPAATPSLVDSGIAVTAKGETMKHKKRKLGDSSDDSDPE
jgi:hypothetical protein